MQVVDVSTRLQLAHSGLIRSNHKYHKNGRSKIAPKSPNPTHLAKNKNKEKVIESRCAELSHYVQIVDVSTRLQFAHSGLIQHIDFRSFF